MDLSTPLRTLAPSLESAILETLAGTEAALNASTIARLSRFGTRTGQWPVLNRLVHHGLVLADRSNSGSLYRLNRDHVLTPSVLAMVSIRIEVLRRLTDAIDGLRPAVLSAAIYGSFARRDADADSDVDLVLVVADGTDTNGDEWTGRVADVEDQFVRWTGNRLEVLGLTMADLHRLVTSGEPLVASWHEDAVTVSGRPFAALLSAGPEPAKNQPRTAKP